MIARICKCTLVAVVAVLVAGCEAPVKPIALETAGVRAKLDYSDLAFVLDKAVTDDGLLIVEALREHADRLDAQLKRLAVTGPHVTPKLFTSPDQTLAYWYNARASWAMKLALARRYPKKLWDGELIDRPFPLDGRTMSLPRIDEILGGYEDWRVLVGSPGVTFRRSRLPAQPFTAADVRSRIAGRISDLIDDPKRVVIDIPNRRILLPAVLWGYREALIQDYHKTYRTEGANLTTVLLQYVAGSAHRRLQDAIGYRCAPAGHLPLLALFVEK